MSGNKPVPIPKKYIRKSETIERIEIVGPMNDWDRVLNTLRADGWAVKNGGPYTDKRMWPRVDVSRFKYVMERTC